jgi:hypothetical protein
MQETYKPHKPSCYLQSNKHEVHESAYDLHGIKQNQLAGRICYLFSVRNYSALGIIYSADEDE